MKLAESDLISTDKKSLDFTGREVSCRAIGILFRALKDKNESPEVLATETGYLVEHLLDKNARISWLGFCQLMTNASKVWTDQELVDLGKQFLNSSWGKPLSIAARMFFTAQDFYRWMATPDGRKGRLFSCIETSFQEIADNQFSYEIRMAPGYSPSPGFFLITKGVFISLPTIVAERPANVKLTHLEDGGIFMIQVSPTDKPITKLRKVLTWPFKAQAAARELHETNAVLQERYVALQTEISERQQIEKQLKSSLTEKEVLLKEIHHRVKNNMQVISSLLDLQASTIQDETTRRLFGESQLRIRSMALVHEQLYQSSDLAHIDLAVYLQNLTDQLCRAYGAGGNNISLKLKVVPITLNIETAISCGLIINELVSNSMKYAFPDNQCGEILVELRSDKDQLILLIQDNGIGLPPEIDIYRTSTLGLTLVITLVKQIRGSITLDSQSRSAFKIVFRDLKTTDTIPRGGCFIT